MTDPRPTLARLSPNPRPTLITTLARHSTDPRQTLTSILSLPSPEVGDQIHLREDPSLLPFASLPFPLKSHIISPQIHSLLSPSLHLPSSPFPFPTLPTPNPTPQALGKQEAEMVQLKQTLSQTTQQLSHIEVELRHTTDSGKKLEAELHQLRDGHERLEAKLAEVVQAKTTLEAELARREVTRESVVARLAALPQVILTLHERINDTLGRPLEEVLRQLGEGVTPQGSG